MTAPDAAEELTCRICFDGADAGELLAACGCSGSQALVHEKCISRWRRVQLVQGKLAASQRCEICRQSYSASLSAPTRPFYIRLRDFFIVVLESFAGLLMLMFSGSFTSAHIIVTLLCFTFGVVNFFIYFALLFPLVILALYAQGFKLSVLSGGGQPHLGLTSFGQPVEGLGKGMILVSLGARGPFAKTVLYVQEHSDSGSLALIMNGQSEDVLTVETASGAVPCCIKTGGPVGAPGCMCIHNVRGVAGSERIDRDRDFFIHLRIGSLRSFLNSCQKQCSAATADNARALIVKGVSSWGPHQLDGEMRRWAWGWVRPEHVNLEDIFHTPGIPSMVNRVMPHDERVENPVRARVAIWERFVNHPHLEVFQA